MTAGNPPVSRLADRYVVEEQVGSGGFATVWRARDTAGGPDIAVKFPKSESETNNSSDEVAARFRQEYDSYSQFEGAPLPSSIARFVVGSRSAPAYIGMEFLDGTELGSVLTSGTARPSRSTMQTYGLPIVRALAYLHANGMCHLDCKPDNVMVRTATDSPALIDFNTVTTTQEAGSTLFYEDGYKPPEQTPSERREEPVGPWSDVYAVGKLLCYLLSGQTLDTSDTPRTGMDPTAYGADCSPAVASILERATKADHTARQQHGGELMTQLLDALGESTQTSLLRDVDSGKQCLVRPGDTVGRVTDNDTLPTITVEDTERHISPVHFACTVDGGWQLEDRSLNGTYVNLSDEWVFLLSDRGYEQLSKAGHERVADGRPYSAARLSGRTIISPVDPSYPLTLELSPDTTPSS
ncbi:serine/threonine-protein kinase [Halosegnis longus]|uniref:serine/threonine-protein kinase n=1 Tax=Halosegnis longus TaxID=2216012 RepID=UPI0009AC826D|nr:MULTISPECIES: FHA domain-containing serine/threonine-protein kinase [Halobacteriales]